MEKKEKIKKISVWLRTHWLLSAFLINFAASIAAIVVVTIMEAITLGMIIEAIINFNLLYILAVIPITATVIFGILLVKQKWKAIIEEREGEIHILQSKLEEREKQYDGLVEQLKLPRLIEELITVEKSTKQDGKPVIISPSEGSKPPSFYFPLRVINRIQCSFTPEEVIVWCSCDSDTLMYEGKWNKDIKLPSTDAGAVDISDLKKTMDGNLNLYVPTDKFRSPISEIEDLSKWKLNGTVKYKAKNPVIPNIEDKEILEIGIKLEYELDEETILKLRMVGGAKK